MTALTKLLHKPSHDTAGQRADRPSTRAPLPLAADTLVVRNAPSQNRAISRALTPPAAPLPPTMVRASTTELNAVVENSNEQFARLKESVVLGLQSDSISPRVRADLSRMIEAHPGNKELLTLRAVASRLLNDPDGCVVDCNAILQLDHTNRFALLHRASAVCSDSIGGHHMMMAIGGYIHDAIMYAESNLEDRLGLLIRTLYVAPSATCEDVVKRLMAALDASPTDVVIGTALLALLLDRRNFNLILPLGLQVEEVARNLMIVDSTHRIARQVMSWTTGWPNFRDLQPVREDFIHLFSDYPLNQQDKALGFYLGGLEARAIT